MRRLGRSTPTEGAGHYPSLLMIGSGAFLIVVALMLRFYAYPALAVAPIDQDSITSLSATDATVLDVATLRPITTDLTVQAHTVGDVQASEDAGDDIRVWHNLTSVRSGDGEIRSRSVERAAFDAVSGLAVNCCREYRATTRGQRVPVQREGLIFKFPFDTQKEDYQLWDTTVGKAFPAEYTGTDDLDGLRVYLFTLTVPETVLGTRELPASMFGIEQVDSVEADVHIRATKTITVEPNTGVIMDRTEDQKQWLVADGVEVVANEAVLSFTDEEVAEMLEDFRDEGTMLGNLRFRYPMLAGLIGLVLLGGGVVLHRRTARRSEARQTPEPVA